MTERPLCVMACAVRGCHRADCPCATPGHTHTPPWDWFTTPADGEPPADAAPACPNCTGCLPRQAGPDTLVCEHCERHTTTALLELPDLWADLAERPRLQGVSRAPDAEDDGPPTALGDRQVAARSDIRAHLVTRCHELRDRHHITAPDEATIAATTRRIAAYHSDMAAQARAAAHIALQPTPDGQAPDPAEHAAMKAEEARHLPLAAAARDDRETGRDVTRALAEHVRRHLHTLLRDADAAPHVVADLTAAHRAARAIANPSRDTRQRITCRCGSWVALDPTEVMTCTGCGTWGVLSWWVEQAATHDATQPMTATDLLGWLLVAHGIDLGPAGHDRIRQWAVRHPDTVRKAGRTDRGATLYEPGGVLTIAQRRPARGGVPRQRATAE